MGARDCQLTGRDVRRGSNLTQPPRDAVGWKAVWVGKRELFACDTTCFLTL